MTCKISVPASVSGGVCRLSRSGASVSSGAISRTPKNGSASPRRCRGDPPGRVKVRHHLAGEEAQAGEHLLLGYRLQTIEQEVDPIDTDRFPALDYIDDPVGTANAQPLRRTLSVAGSGRLLPELWEETERGIGLGRVGLARRQELRGQVAEGIREAPPGRDPAGRILMAEKEVDRADGSLRRIAGRESQTGRS